MVNNLQSKLESLLLVMPGPVSFKKLAKIIGTSAQEVKKILEQANSQYHNENHGWHLTFTDDKVQLVTNPAHTALIEKSIKTERKEELTPAALETLAVVVYKGPLRKAEIDFIRGVNSVYTLRSLMIRGLIQRGHNAQDGRGFLYSITSDFLNYLGLSSISELPEHQEMVKKLKEIELSSSAESENNEVNS